MDDFDEDRLASLTQLFKDLEVDDPDLVAHSELSEGIPQLARYAFIRALWAEIRTSYPQHQELAAEMAIKLCYILDSVPMIPPALEHVQWRLFAVDEDEQPIAPLGGSTQKWIPPGRRSMFGAS